jgi:hypothetical protein
MKKLESISFVLIISVVLFMCITLLIKRDLEDFYIFTGQSFLILFVFYLFIFWTSKRINKKRTHKNEIIVSGLITVICFIFFEILEAILYRDDYYQRYYRVSGIWNNLYNKDSMYIEHGRIILTFIITILIALTWGLFKYKDYSIKIKRIFFMTIAALSFLGSTFLISIIIIETYKPGKIQVVNNEDDSKVEQMIIQSEKFTDLQSIFNFYSLNDRPTLVTFWTNGCGSMSHQIEKLEKIKKEIEPLNLNYLYINGEYNDKIKDVRRINNFIESKSISGYHVYLARDKFHKILIEDYGFKKGLTFTKSLLFDKNMKLIKTDIPIPHYKTALKDTLLKYCKK